MRDFPRIASFLIENMSIESNGKKKISARIISCIPIILFFAIILFSLFFLFQKLITNVLGVIVPFAD